MFYIRLQDGIVFEYEQASSHWFSYSIDRFQDLIYRHVSREGAHHITSKTGLTAPLAQLLMSTSVYPEVSSQRTRILAKRLLIRDLRHLRTCSAAFSRSYTERLHVTLWCSEEAVPARIRSFDSSRMHKILRNSPCKCQPHVICRHIDQKPPIELRSFNGQ